MCPLCGIASHCPSGGEASRTQTSGPTNRKISLEVVSCIMTSTGHFFNASDMARGTAVPSGMPMEMIGYDVNQYNAPIVIAWLGEN
jgi:hypothetical protein